MLQDFLHNILHNLFQPLLLFFYLGFLIPIFRVSFDFPHVLYQGLTMYLLIAIGWHGGEELASLRADELEQAVGFMGIGFVTNFFIGVLAYYILRGMTRLRRIDAATVGGYYGSDSAGTFVTCVGVLTVANLAYAPYMPVMLAVMEIPGCLVALFLASWLRRKGMDAMGHMPDEPGYVAASGTQELSHQHSESAAEQDAIVAVAVGNGQHVVAAHARVAAHASHSGSSRHGHGDGNDSVSEHSDPPARQPGSTRMSQSIFSAELLHEVFLNPGLFLLFGGIAMGFASRFQGADTKSQDELFYALFKGMLCLFLLEMGITASKRIRDLGRAGWGFIAFGVLAPNLFATIGICVAHLYSLVLGTPFAVGTYVLFAVLCGAASYIAVPAVQRLAIPEASPTLPLAAALGLTFSYNVTIGIPVYILIATSLTSYWPVGA